MPLTPELEARLVGLARQAYPAVAIEREGFVAFVAAHASAGDLAGAADQEERVGELLLAWAIRAGDAAASAAFDRKYIAPLERTLGKMQLSAALLDEVKQRVREKLMATGRLDEYAGRGRLSGLVQVVATREALSILRTTRKEAPLGDDHLAGQVEQRWDHGWEWTKAQYRGAFREAFSRAVAALEPRQRTLLRLHLVGGVGLEELAGVYNVHRATIVRWLHGAREAVKDATRTHLRELLAVRADELESLMGEVASRLDVSLEGLLSTHAEEEVGDQ